MDSLAVVIPKSINILKFSWPDEPSFKQNWSLPDSLIYYISKNPSTSKCYQKMIESCKFFFEQNPIIVVQKAEICKENENGINILLCANEHTVCQNNGQRCCVKMEIKNILCKIWIIDEIFVAAIAQNFISLLSSKIYRCEIAILSICDKIVLYKDLTYLASSAKKIRLWKCSIIYDDGNTVMLDKIMECFPNIENFQLTFCDEISIVNTLTVKNITKLPNLRNLKKFHLGKIPESFVVEDLSAFFDKYKDAKIWLSFNENISLEYKDQLDSVIDNVIESNALNRVIAYDYQDEEKIQIMTSRFWLTK